MDASFQTQNPMSILSRLRLDRENWFICYDCLGENDHDEAKAIFHTKAAKILVLGRPIQQCPRCGKNNTKSFAELKAEGRDSTVWGLERAVKKHPRQQFEVNDSPKSPGLSQDNPTRVGS